MKSKKLAIMFVISSLIFAQTALAGRFGGGRSRGMQRSFSSAPHTPRYSQPMQQQNTYQQPSQQRRGMGAGTAGALGVAAGAAGGYLLGKSMSNNNQNSDNQQARDNNPRDDSQISQNNQHGSTNQIPWGIIGILGLLLIAGVMFFRKKSLSSNPNLNNKVPDFNMNKFMSPLKNSEDLNSNSANQTTNPNNSYRMPDGIESIYFLRQVKGNFLHIQSMNNLENINEIAKYMTPSLYTEMQEEVANNTQVADFPTLDCNLVNTEIKDDQILASVRFFGLISENAGDAPKPFSEIWNFTKPNQPNSRWLVTGIQQESSNA